MFSEKTLNLAGTLVLDLIDILIDSIESSETVFLDLAKAFDRVNHKQHYTTVPFMEFHTNGSSVI